MNFVSNVVSNMCSCKCLCLKKSFGTSSSIITIKYLIFFISLGTSSLYLQLVYQNRILTQAVCMLGNFALWLRVVAKLLDSCLMMDLVVLKFSVLRTLSWHQWIQLLTACFLVVIHMSSSIHMKRMDLRTTLSISGRCVFKQHL